MTFDDRGSMVLLWLALYLLPSYLAQTELAITEGPSEVSLARSGPLTVIALQNRMQQADNDCPQTSLVKRFVAR